MSEKVSYKENSLIFKALSDETRLKIVDMLSCGELCACVILESFQITQPTLSYHMKILSGCQLVNSRKEGAWVHYSLNNEKMKALSSFLEYISSTKQDCICRK